MQMLISNARRCTNEPDILWGDTKSSQYRQRFLAPYLRRCPAKAAIGEEAANDSAPKMPLLLDAVKCRDLIILMSEQK